MHCLKMSVTKVILGLSIILYTAGQVSSLKCYVCTSTIGQDCYNNPKKKEFEVTCPEARNSDSIFSSVVDSSLLSALVDDPGTRDGEVPVAPVPHVCCAVKGTILGTEGVIRSCQLKSASKEDITKAAPAGLVVKSVDLCENDLCNSFDAPTTTSPVPPVISTTHPPTTPTTPQKPLPSSSSKPSPAPSSTHAPVPPTTNAPNSSKALNTAFLSLASSLFLVYFVKL